MNYIQAILLSIVEGITEFLPISSTGHLILAADALMIPQTDFVKTFEIAIQLGAISSVLFLYRKTLLNNAGIWKNILIAFIPTMLIGLFFYKFIKNTLIGNSDIVVVSLILGGIFLIAFEYFYNKKSSLQNIEKIGIREALLIGFLQSVSVIPGVSRAGATIVAGLISGLDRRTAVEFSFLLAVPTMLAATGLDLAMSAPSFTLDQLGILIVGFVGAFVSAHLVIKLFVEFIRKNNFILFGIYRIVVGVLFLLY